MVPWSRIFADHIGAAIANARAFDEIQHLKGQLELQNAYLQEAVVEAKAFGDLVGQSAGLRHIVGQVDVVAPTEASVLILGETGTGKELVAHEIHRRSARKDGPLVRVNCASIPRELFESEFFGHVRGSFTGAMRDRAGRFETAEGGTIFLDEVGEIPLDIQNKLLRVLQEKRYERVGDDRTRQANVRIVAATNRDLKKAAAAGKFREDLYYRLNVFPIQVPPLRERLDDIPILAKHFVELSARELKCAKPRLTRAAVTQLQSYDWPGNGRETSRSPSSSLKSRLNASNVTISCEPWRRPIGRSADPIAPPNYWESNQLRCFQG
jgi:transcriptional regulator with GAF, ATPase, and Fis domain